MEKQKMNIRLTKPYIDERELDNLKEVLCSGWYTQGPKVLKFEENMAEIVGVKHAIACTSGTTALFSMLKALGIGKSDEVIVPSFTFIATPNSVTHVGAKVVFADISKDIFNLDPKSVEKVISPRTRAILAVDQIGIPAPLNELRIIAEKNNLILLEDAACAVGTQIDNKLLGGTNHSLASCFSFHPRKLITTGEGGMVVTNNDDLAKIIRQLVSHGASVDELDKHNANEIVKEHYPIIGYNFRMSDFQAAVGIGQVEKLKDIVNFRRTKAAFYENKLKGVKGIELPLIPSNVKWNYQSFALRITPEFGKSRDEVLKILLSKGIAARGSLTECHKEAPYKNLKYELPITELVSKEFLILPLHPQISEEEQKFVVDQLIKCKN